MAKQDSYIRYTIRVPAKLYERVQQYADENGRSINAEIMEILEYGLWHTDTDRMEAGRDLPRPMTDDERELVARSKELLERLETKSSGEGERDFDLSPGAADLLRLVDSQYGSILTEIQELRTKLDTRVAELEKKQSVSTENK